ncbi:ATP-binding protein (plasmid) [Streptomyces sp. BHT-5-2]|uniref:ATP-binding protein n=1 Tax=Streptomyces sp. BHT-5-2 TaxID=2866715 RepID=UPI001C8DC6C5|nr:ATP-binding protein [Streptomyces sp. BHT-5-2]QZL08230.1 ATP-binding protein [Streptomyces sp. BHT-5-2]
MNSTVRSSEASSGICETPAEIGEFAMRFTSTRRGARLARRLASHRLDEWGYPYETEINESVSAVVGELAANAVRHGHVPGRDFALRLTVSVAAAETRALRFRVEVSDTRSERLPMVALGGGAGAAVDGGGGLVESGRGLLIVACIADSWGVVPRQSGPGKTVWAEYAATAVGAAAGTVGGRPA